MKHATRRLVEGCALTAVASLLACFPAYAQSGVRMRTGANGTLEITNDGGGAFHFHAQPLVLRAVPRAEWNELILQHSVENGVDPKLVQAIMQVESAYNPRAISRTGACGLMQLMPDTAKLVQVADLFSPADNIRGGVRYLRQMIERFGRLESAIAAYNAGPGAVQRHNGVPPYAETRDYVDRVLTLYRGTGGSVLTGLISFGGSGAPARPNGLTKAALPSPLQNALARGSLGAPAPPPPAATQPLPVPVAQLAAATTQKLAD